MTIIRDEKLKEEETRKYLENAFREGEIKTAGTDIDKIMPPVSRFGGGGRAKKKQGVIDKLKGFFEKYFGVGGSAKFTEPRITSPVGVQQNIDPNNKMITYDFTQQKPMMVAESPVAYGKKKDKE